MEDLICTIGECEHTIILNDNFCSRCDIKTSGAQKKYLAHRSERSKRKGELNTQFFIRAMILPWFGAVVVLSTLSLIVELSNNTRFTIMLVIPLGLLLWVIFTSFVQNRIIEKHTEKTHPARTLGRFT